MSIVSGSVSTDELFSENVALYAGVPVTGVLLLVILLVVVVMLRRQVASTDVRTSIYMLIYV